MIAGHLYVVRNTASVTSAMTGRVFGRGTWVRAEMKCDPKKGFMPCRPDEWAVSVHCPGQCFHGYALIVVPSQVMDSETWAVLNLMGDA